jgi:hypothetical protein
MTVGELRKALEGLPDDMEALSAPADNYYSYEPVGDAAVKNIMRGCTPHGMTVWGMDNFPGPVVEAFVIE